MKKKKLIMLGIRGVPANHGGFETFAEYLCKNLINRGWDVTVYCQKGTHGDIYESDWQGVKRIHIPVMNTGPLGTIIFDLKSVIHSLKHDGVFLTLGYNTAIFNLFYRVAGKVNIINMDGIEWKRKKWGLIAKTWFWLNEHFGCWFGNHLIADHPNIENHLATRVSRKKITMIPYGGLAINHANETILSQYQLKVDGYGLVIARAEPENSILEIIRAFSSKKRKEKLVVLGRFDKENVYHQQVLASSSEDVIFLGAIYEPESVAALRFHSRFYVHGHQVGGTNPSLVEALGASCAVLAHDNPFNRWVAADAALYFDCVSSAEKLMDKLFIDDQLQARLKKEAGVNFNQRFQWKYILSEYESLLINFSSDI